MAECTQQTGAAVVGQRRLWVWIFGETAKAVTPHIVAKAGAELYSRTWADGLLMETP